MFSAIGLGVIDASFAIRQPDGTLVPLDRFEMLGAPRDGRAEAHRRPRRTGFHHQATLRGRRAGRRHPRKRAAGRAAMAGGSSIRTHKMPAPTDAAVERTGWHAGSPWRDAVCRLGGQFAGVVAFVRADPHRHRDAVLVALGGRVAALHGPVGDRPCSRGQFLRRHDAALRRLSQPRRSGLGRAGRSCDLLLFRPRARSRALDPPPYLPAGRRRPADRADPMRPLLFRGPLSRR